MLHLHLTLDTPAENLALDEALLGAVEAGEIDVGVLRLWEAPTYCVVLGRSSSAEIEVNLGTCRKDRVPVLRRSSGGGTILAGPGCLMYALVLGFQDYPQLQWIDHAHQFVLEKLSTMLMTDRLTTDGSMITPAGTSDLAIRRAPADPLQKFSGNAIRLKRKHILYHGTLLYDFDLPCLHRWLATPTRTPDYRDDREHAEFVTNLGIRREVLVKRITDGWEANEALSVWPQQRTAEIVKTKYTDDPLWNLYTPTA